MEKSLPPFTYIQSFQHVFSKFQVHPWKEIKNKKPTFQQTIVCDNMHNIQEFNGQNNVTVLFKTTSKLNSLLKEQLFYFFSSFMSVSYIQFLTFRHTWILFFSLRHSVCHVPVLCFCELVDFIYLIYLLHFFPLFPSSSLFSLCPFLL